MAMFGSSWNDDFEEDEMGSIASNKYDRKMWEKAKERLLDEGVSFDREDIKKEVEKLKEE